jgi:hypothetical protein
MKDVARDVSQFERSRDSSLVVEAALEGAVQTIRERDALAAEMGALLKRVQDEPVGSSALPELRARLAEAQSRMQELQKGLAKHAALVQVWLRQKETPKR